MKGESETAKNKDSSDTNFVVENLKYQYEL